MTVPYDPEKSSIFILLAVRGTVVPMVLTRPLFWLLVSMETALLVLKDRYPDDYPELQYGVIGPLVSLLSFFIVFYGNQCYTRFYKMYDLSKALVGCCQEWATLARTFLPNKGVARWNATRHIVAALQLEYFSLTSNNVDDDEWEALIEHSLLTKAECDLVGSFKGFKPMLLIGWALKEVEEQLGIGHGRDNKYFGEYKTFLHTAFKMRGACAAIVGTLGQPVPFPYFHLLTFMLSSTCLLVGLVLPSFASDVATSIFCSTPPPHAPSHISVHRRRGTRSSVVPRAYQQTPAPLLTPSPSCQPARARRSGFVHALLVCFHRPARPGHFAC